MNNKFVVIDTETTGLNPDSADLLELAMVAVGIPSPGIVDIGETISIKIKHDEYIVSPDALEINKIDLIKHHKVALDKTEVAQEIVRFLLTLGFTEKNPAVIIGHNVSFDVSFLKGLLYYSHNEVFKLFSHRTIDTSTLGRVLFHSGLVNKDLGSSQELFNYFNTHSVTNLPCHTALGDAIRTAFAFKQIVELLGGFRIND